MATGRQNQSQGRQDSGAAGAMQGAREQIREMGQGLQERAQQAGQRFREGYDATREELAHRYRRAEGMIARHPGTSVLTAFGVGFGLGVFLSILLTQREEPESWYERYVPESLRDFPERVREVPDRLRSMGKRIRRNLPETIARQME
ncbi:MAG: hypothetical protein IRY99_28155 [Isosphaeraceae bacterium]|nr:hypothetical protein [Isosphaeraceae bacterium]